MRPADSDPASATAKAAWHLEIHSDNDAHVARAFARSPPAVLAEMNTVAPILWVPGRHYGVRYAVPLLQPREQPRRAERASHRQRRPP